jgi:neutral ceramidase
VFTSQYPHVTIDGDELLMKYLFCILLTSACWLAGVGCVSYRLHVPAYNIVRPDPPLEFVAGAAKRDITPPPGYPLAGHSISAGVARGYWTQLNVRAFYFRDTGGRVLAMAACDLFAVPAGLRAEVLRRVNRSGVYLPPDSFLLTATHTHHGPGGFMTSSVYNGLGAALPGFDAKLFDTLADRIADALREAAANARPATLALRVGSAPNLQRNRAIVPFLLNPPADRDAVNRLAREGGVSCVDCPRLTAVDPTLTTLEVLHQGTPAALLVFYAIHPTAMSHECPLYQSDLTGYAMDQLEQSVPVAGFFNGAEGDISPDWDRQTRDDVLLFGGLLAQAVRDLRAKPAVTPAEPLRLSTVVRNFPNNWRSDRPNGAPKFANEPSSGAAQIGGAEDGRTAFFYVAGWRAGFTSDAPTGRDGDQGDKEPGLRGPLKKLLDDLDAGAISSFPLKIDLARAITRNGYPERFPVAVAGFGDLLTLAAIPVEMTTTMGTRVRTQLEPLWPGSRVVLVGLANEYFSYTTTPAEYAAQQYEAASTLAGPQEGPAIGDMLASLAGQPAEPAEHVQAASFRVGPKRKIGFVPAILGRVRNMVDEDLESLLPPALAKHESRIPRTQWDETPESDWKSGERRVRVLDAASGAEVGSAVDILKILADSRGTARRWNALWVAPEPGRAVYFEVMPPGGTRLCSAAFRTSDPQGPGHEWAASAEGCKLH